MFHLVICITIGTFCPVQIKKRPCGRPTKKEMTLDCPFRNPLQSRVISVLSYYLTSYGYLRFYWIRSAAIPKQSSSSSTTVFFLPLLRPNSSYVRPLVGFPSCLPYGLGFALTENRLHAGRLRDIRPSES